MRTQAPEHRSRIRQAAAERSRWHAAFKPIYEAAEARDVSLATRLLLEYILDLEPEETQRPLTRREQRALEQFHAQAAAFDEAQRQAEINARGEAWERLAEENRARLRGRDRALGRPRSMPRRGTA